MKTQSEKGYTPLPSFIKGTAAEGINMPYLQEVLEKGIEEKAIPSNSVEYDKKGISIKLSYSTKLRNYLADKGIDAKKKRAEKIQKEQQDLRETIRNHCVESQKRLEQRLKEQKAKERKTCAKMSLNTQINWENTREGLLCCINLIDEEEVYTPKYLTQFIGIPATYLGEKANALGSMGWSQDHKKMGWLGKNVRLVAIDYMNVKFPSSR